MCPLKEVCEFYGKGNSAKLSENELKLMKNAFCESELFLLNNDCKIFYLYMKSIRPADAMLPVGKF
jgi:hypothetical protein